VPYTHFRYIAYEVPTATNRTDISNPPVASGFPPGAVCDPVADIPVPAHGSVGPADWFVRLRRLAAVVNMAGLNLKADNPSTLKVFVVPEFYLRPPNPATHNTYASSDMISIWDALDRMFRSPRFKHWLIVAGTAMWNMDTMTRDQHPIYYNTLFYVRGGVASGEVRRIEKKLPSTIDGIPTQYAPGKDAEVKALYEDYELRRERLFDIDGVPIGVEICLDHIKTLRVLKSTLQERLTTAGDLWAHGAPALHVLTAGGMPLELSAVAARPNGYFLRNDGYANPPVSELRKVRGYKTSTGNPAQAWDDGGVVDLDADPHDAVEYPIPAGALTVPGLPGPHPYDMPEQRLRIYPAKALP
jgi:hypothetical protein